ncbi:MAG: hypothetical protein Q4D16_11400 [Eubacteriales bacterium]|nr:hypothetical protein [Eubacteriales bacterium]
MKKRLVIMLTLATMLVGTCVTAGAAEKEADKAAVQETEAADEDGGKAEDRNYDPEAGTGWLAADLNEEPVEFEFDSAAKGMTGTTYTFKSENFTMTFMLNKSLEVGTEMDKNAITQIEVVSSDKASVGYYFVKKSPGQDVDSTVTLEKSEDGLVQGTFTVTVPTAERYVGDNKPGILEQLVFTEGEFCFHE